MDYSNNQIIKYEPNIYMNTIIFPPRDKCNKCNQVHYYNTDKEICELSNNMSLLNINTGNTYFYKKN